MQCPATLPFSFAAHTYLVVNRKGDVHRYGVGHHRAQANGTVLFGSHRCRECIGHIHKDGRPPEEGIEIVPLYFPHSPLWRSRVVCYVEGESGSLAGRMGAFIEQSFRVYPHADRYRLTGPNSNTYPAWVLAHFPESGMRLPWNAIGKNY